jgi:TonB family protein
MKIIFAVLTAAYFLTVSYQCRAQSDYLISVEFYNAGIDLFNRGNYASADTAFTRSLNKCPSAETYYNRAMTRKKLGSMEGFCNDMYMATANGDSLSKMIFINKCTTTDTIYHGSHAVAKIVASHTYDSNEDIITTDTSGKLNWNSGEDTIAFSCSDTSMLLKTQVRPVFPGNEEGVALFLKRNLKYPAVSLSKKIEGTVIVIFTISREGKTGNVKILKGVNEEIDREAARIIGKMPHWFPGMQDGKFVAVQYQLPVRFSLKN